MGRSKWISILLPIGCLAIAACFALIGLQTSVLYGKSNVRGVPFSVFFLFGFAGLFLIRSVFLVFLSDKEFFTLEAGAKPKESSADRLLRIGCLAIAMAAAAAYHYFLVVAKERGDLQAYFALAFWKGVPNGMEEYPKYAPTIGGKFLLEGEFRWLFVLVYFFCSRLPAIVSKRNHKSLGSKTLSFFDGLLLFVGCAIGVPSVVSQIFIYPHILPERNLAETLKNVTCLVLLLVFVALDVLGVFPRKKVEKDEKPTQRGQKEG
jgi:hypothetical protein